MGFLALDPCSSLCLVRVHSPAAELPLVEDIQAIFPSHRIHLGIDIPGYWMVEHMATEKAPEVYNLEFELLF